MGEEVGLRVGLNVGEEVGLRVGLSQKPGPRSLGTQGCRNLGVWGLSHTFVFSLVCAFCRIFSLVYVCCVMFPLMCVFCTMQSASLWQSSLHVPEKRNWGGRLAISL